MKLVYKPFKKIAHKIEIDYNNSLVKNILNLINSGIEYKYPEHYKNYDYIDSIFIESEIKNVPFYLCEFKTIEDIECLGFYFNTLDKIIISKEAPIADPNPVKFIREEILMHELLHYIFYHFGFYPETAENKEIFAYAFMMKYWKNNLHYTDEIIKKKMYPYFYNKTDKNKILSDFMMEKENILLEDFLSFSNNKKQELHLKYENEFKEKIDNVIQEKEQDFINNCLNSDRNYIIKYLGLERKNANI